MTDKLVVLRRNDGDWTVTEVKTKNDRPVVGTVLTTVDIWLLGSHGGWEIKWQAPKKKKG